MWDAGLFKDSTLRQVTAFEVEAFGVQLSMQDRLAKLALTCKLHQIVEYPASDPFTAPLEQYGHPANLDVIAVSRHPAASDRPITIESEDMSRDGIFVIQFDCFRYTLLLDKDSSTQGPSLFHRGLIANHNDRYRRAGGHNFGT